MTSEAKASGARRTTAARVRFPLFLKIFLLVGLAISVVVASAVLVTVRRANTVANQSVNAAISAAGRLYFDLEQNRLRLLSLGATSVGRDVNFVAYLEDALQAGASSARAAGEPDKSMIDTISILDQIESRRGALASDLVIVTDDQGYQLARTDEPASTGSGTDLYEQMPLVKAAIDDSPVEPATGIIVTKGRLYHAAVAPIGVGAGGVVQGYVINARAIDQRFADQVAETTRTGVAFVPAGEGSGAEIARSTNAPNAASLRSMPETSLVATTGEMSPAHRATIDGGKFVITAEPLRAAGAVAAVAVFVRSLDAELAPFREIQRTLVLAGLAALVLAFLLSGLIARRITRPIADLASAAHAVAEGDLSISTRVETSDEVGVLASSFAKMISTLRDKAELEDLYAQMAARSEATRGESVLEPAAAREGTVMVTDLRGLSVDLDPGEAIARLDEIVRMQENEVRRQDGLVASVSARQVVSVFDGQRGVVHAVRAARAIGENLATPGSGRDLSIGVGIATGAFVSGGLRTQSGSASALSGETPLLATLFALDAPSGSMFLSEASAQQAGGELLATAGRAEVSLRWLPEPVAVAHVPLVGVTTGMIRAVTQTGAAEETMRLDADALPRHAPRELEPGSSFAARYRIEGVLGRGGMGVVYKATDLQLDEVVAIKTLPQRAVSSSPEDVERFKREIRVARKITHRNVLRTFDYGEADGWYFISMEYVRGFTLADMMEQPGPMTVRSALGVMRQISRGLEAAHEQGVIHRDIKPPNVLIDHRGEVKLMDFGIARVQEAEAMTQQGTIVGTPHYMSPEQVQGKALDARSDVYSMGVMMYEMLCGARPFDSSSLTAVLTAHVVEDPLPPIRRRQEIGKELNSIVMRCLSKNPASRFKDAGALLEALNGVSAEE
jgi:eukaryotic-like serine/threonine-protein kinase